MTLDQLRALCAAAPAGAWHLSTIDDAGLAFIRGARTHLPLLLAVAEAARRLSEDAYNIDDRLTKDVDAALAALEAAP